MVRWAPEPKWEAAAGGRTYEVRTVQPDVIDALRRLVPVLGVPAYVDPSGRPWPLQDSSVGLRLAEDCYAWVDPFGPRD